MIQSKVVTGTSNYQKYQDEILESGVRPPLDPGGEGGGYSDICIHTYARVIFWGSKF